MYEISNVNDVRKVIETRNTMKWNDEGVDQTDMPVTPDWDSAVTKVIATPWGSRATRAYFTDPLLHGYEVRIIADTVPSDYDFDNGDWDTQHGIVPERITTMTMRFPRCILPEVNTHRVFSRNSASSRARSFKTTLRPIMEDAYVPLFTENMKGMGGQFISSSGKYLDAANVWLQARDRAVYSLLNLLLGDENLMTEHGHLTPDNDELTGVEANWEELIDKYMDAYRNGTTDDNGMLSVHKQNANRLIEPFMWHEALVTSTYWANFLELRISDAAQPEIKALAILVRKALRSSIPVKSWAHIPFGNVADLEAAGTWDEVNNILLAAASECARISYNDRSTMENKTNSNLGRKLLAQKHMSPFEHIALSSSGKAPDVVEGFFMNLDDTREGSLYSSNLAPSWIQYRRIITAPEQ